MAKNKKGASGKKAARLRAAAGAPATAHSKMPPAHGRSGQQQSRKWAVDPTSADLSLPGTSMQQLALNTRNNASHWDQNSSLRGRPVIFVSGGFVEPLAEIKPNDNEPTTSTTPIRIAPLDGANPLEESSETSTPTISPETFLPGVETTSTSQVVTQAMIDNDSDSSNEVILFKGRDSRKDTRPVLSEPASIAALGDSLSPLTNQPSPSQNMDLDLLVADSDNDGGSDAAVNDYIQNMSTEDMADMVRLLTANHRELGELDNDIFIDGASDDDDEGNSSDRRGDIDGGTASPTTRKGRNETRSRQTQKATDNRADSDGSDDGWQLATDSDDEHLANLLAEQEELDLGVNDLILLDSDAATTATRSARRPRRPKGSLHWSNAALAKYGFTKGYRASNGPYPSAEAVADAFEQLEVNGWSSNRGGFEIELSDSELESTLKASWQKDRQRKKDRKRAREELRAQGLLGKKANPNDPRVKYPNGMSLDDVKGEFQSFLLGSDQCFTLSPMDAHTRKIVHEIAYRFNITSKSTGSGEQRRPTLVRTKSTVRFNEEMFQSVFARYRRRFFARLDNKATGAGKKAAARRGGDPGAASVRNGEVVGGSAPEISLANKGRTMLEKMGWSTGMALGAMDNKGMTQIIEHIVKRSKAGLG